jgi:predicted permease
MDVKQAAGSVPITAYALDSVPFGRDPAARRVVAAFVDEDYWRVLGARLAVGRSFTGDETRIERATSLAIVSDAFWRRQLNQRSDILGATIDIGPLRYTIVGVAAPGFAGVDLDDAEMWLPLGAMPMPKFSQSPWYGLRSTPLLRAIVRVTADTHPLDARLTAAFRAGAVAAGVRYDSAAVVSTGSILSALGPLEPSRAVQVSTRLAAVSILVLLIACANVANLLLARAVRRRRETAVRLALGISRRRLAGQAMIDSILLATGAGVAATLAGAWTGGALRRLLLPEIHWGGELLDWRAAMATAGVALVAALVTGLPPLLQARRLDVNDALKSGRDGTRRGRRLRTTLVVAQTALTVVLLVGAGLFVRSLRHVLGIDVGYDVDRIVHATPVMIDEHGGQDETHRTEVDAALVEASRRLASSANVDGVALAFHRPMGGYLMSGIKIPGFDSTPSLNGSAPSMDEVSPEFTSVTGMRIVAGRALRASDVEGAPPVALVNETMARTIWPGRSPIGQAIDPFGSRGSRYTIVGVVRDAHRFLVVEPASMQFYLPLGQATVTGGRARASSLVVRARANQVAAATAETERVMRAVLPNSVPNVMVLRGSLQQQFRMWRIGATLFSALGAVALVVAVLGVYGVIAYEVGQRTHEMGIRIALGAQRGRVIGLVVGQAARTSAIGLLLGTCLAIAAGRLVAALLYETSPSDPLVLLTVAGVMLAAAGLASLVPAWRAAAVDPCGAMRAE